jgi:hypothetical protein
MKRLAWACLVAYACTACEGGTELSPIAPSGDARSAAQRELGAEWSPYIGIHITGQALSAYLDAVPILVRAGRLKGVRLEINKKNQNPTDPIIKTIGGLGVEVLGLIGNEYLFEPDVEQEIDRILADYPEIRYFQIGNEVTTIMRSTGPTISIEEYMSVLERVYTHVQRRHPGRAILLTQSTLGFGRYGPQELEAMAGLGLRDMDPNKIVIAINAYDPDSSSQYSGILGGVLRRFRVWVTESGVSDPALHASFVQEKYPLLRDYLRAERVYWYVMWGGDSGDDADFSLIKNPDNFPNYWKSPLFELLAGTR